MCLVGTLHAFAQAGPIQYRYKNIHSHAFSASEISDTTLNGQEIFAPNYKNSISNLNLGNIGQPWLNLAGPHICNGFSLGLNAYRNYMIDPNQFIYISPYKSACTDIRYFQGSRANGVVNLDLIHTQYIKKKYPIALVLNRLGSTGDYLHQNTDWYNTQIMGSLYNKDSNYIFTYRFSFSKGTIEHNGGIKDTNYFNSADYSYRNFSPVNLNMAQSKLNSKQIQIVQQIPIWKKLKKLNDSVTAKTYKFRVTHFLNLYTFKYAYTDDSLDGLTYPYRNYGARSNDSIMENRLSNKLVWTSDSSFIYYVEHSYISINNPSKTTFNNIKVGVSEQIKLRRNQTLLLSYYEYLTGYNNGDFGARGDYTREFFKLKDSAGNKYSKTNINLSFEYIANEADYLSNNFLSNHYRWSADMDKVIYTHYSVNFKKLNAFSHSIVRQKLSLNYYTIKNYVYNNPLSIPTQYHGTITGVNINYSIQGNLLKHLAYNINLNYNYASDNYYLRLPNYATKSSIYYTGKFLKSPLNYQLGADVFWFSKIRSYQWNPVAGVFYFDNLHYTGNYPLIDFFFNAEIYQVQLYLKLEHAFWGLPSNYQFLPNEYYSTTAYPLQPRAVRFGLRWRLGG